MPYTTTSSHSHGLAERRAGHAGRGRRVERARHLGRDDGRLGAPLARARHAAARRGRDPRRERLHRRRRRRRAPRRRRCGACDEAGHRRADRFVGAERARRAAVDRSDAAGRAGRDGVDRQSRARPTPACSPRRFSRSATKALRSAWRSTSAAWRRKWKKPRRNSRPNPQPLADVKYSIVTFGCRVNQADSFQIEEQLIAAGGTASATQDADLVVVNTCSVTGSADQGTRQIVRKIARENPDAQNRRDRLLCDPASRRGRRPSWRRSDRSERSQRDLASAAEPKRSGLTTARAVRRRRRRVRRGDRARPGRPHRLHASRADRLRSGLLVLHHSVDARDRAAAGRVHECCPRSTASAMPAIARSPSPACISGRTAAIWLTGRRCSSLLETIERHAPGMRFRISSLEPMDCSDEIVDLVAASACFAPHFHLPLQHASDRDAGRDAPAVHAGVLPPARRSHSRATFRTRRSAPTSSSASLAKPTKTSRVLEAYLAGVAADARARVSLFRSAGHGGRGAARQSARLGRSRARGRRSRDRPRAEPAVSPRAGRHQSVRA